MVQTNTRSLRSDDRIHLLIHEISELKKRALGLRHRQRDLDKEELWTTRQGHTFAATGNSKACHGSAILIHKRWTKHIKDVRHAWPRLTGVSIVKRKFTRDTETSMCSKCTPSSSSTVTGAGSRTNTHILIGGDFSAQVGSNDETEAIDSTYIENTQGQWLRHWAVQTRSAKSKTTTKPRTTQPNNASNLTLYP